MKNLLKISLNITIATLAMSSLALAQATTTISTSTTVTIVKANCEGIVSKNASFGRKGDEVFKVQSFLNSYENTKIPTTGNFHNLTLKAVKDFQVKYSITPVSGIVGPKTRAKINEIYCKDLGASYKLFPKVNYVPKKIVVSNNVNTNIKMLKSADTNKVSTKINTPILTLSTPSTIMVNGKAMSTSTVMSSSTAGKAISSVSGFGSKLIAFIKSIPYLFIFIALGLLYFLYINMRNILSSSKEDEEDKAKEAKK
jgi:peptidoglycan hydrolase-like protein with peptidoglycan-binding domain